MYTIHQISTILNAEAIINNDAIIEYLLIDSRKISFPNTSLFFALVGNRRDGHSYIKDAYKQGVRHFVIKHSFDTSEYSDANFLIVNDTLNALQTLAAHHRKQFNIPVIGITGSNGKTIVKEWLNQLLQNDFNIVRSPRSYNSQVGVPLSIWQMKAANTLGIFEAGISTVDEMENLQKIIQPTIGILTNIGVAHNDGFENNRQKIQEKLKLTKDCKQIICNGDDELIRSHCEKLSNLETFYWGKNTSSNLQIIEEVKTSNKTTLKAFYQNKNIEIVVPFTDEASIANACTCWAAMLLLGLENNIIIERMLQLQPVEMRMQLLPVINNCILINDSYSNDSSSFYIALDYLVTNATNRKKTIIVSDFSGIEKTNAAVYINFIEQLSNNKIDRVVGIGTEISKYPESFINKGIEPIFYETTSSFLNSITTHSFKDEYILLKGGRSFNFERISKWLQQKTHQTVMEINLTALVHNLKEYQKNVLPTTKTMAMVKAFSYGSGSIEIAKALQFHKVDYLAVAYTDEGIDLRKAGISLPIMILNVEEENFDALIEYNLEPEIFSFTIYKAFHQYLLQQGISDFPVHIKFNTGMNRLGFEVAEANELATLLATNKTMLVKSVLSHLAASEDTNQDEFTKHQQQLFEDACSIIHNKLNYNFIKHIANSAAIFRNPSSQYDMVRLGIGLYGVDSAVEHQLQLQTVATLKTTIAQIRTVKANDSIGYNRRGVVTRDSKIATVRIGYADGLSRSLSNGKGSMFLHNRLAPIIGSVCMDMTMIDITDIPEAKENDTVEIFGKHLPVQDIAKWSNTIAYETLSTISQRLRRIYVEE
ncbi:MAG: bifunctional UDP-N-acetylmuramoyl-tripeptide:D-alanyl-D-alanine ligase/alanine racemase [Bacteroidetes bacterium]|nr:bifunctional UDP-N-acetylmuramoyl-tripeptide:D-alanyl-D-alanine ligase/alanine racemase [Bacteroidota bacterium]